MALEVCLQLQDVYLHRPAYALEEVWHDEGQDTILMQDSFSVLKANNVIPSHTQIGFQDIPVPAVDSQKRQQILRA